MRQGTFDYAAFMFGRRNASKDIWRAVVMAGAMLGAGTGCGGSSSATGTETTPVTNTAPTDGTGTAADPATDNPCAGMVEGDNPCQPVTDNPCGDMGENPCGDGWEEGAEGERVRGSGDEGGVGRGFILG